VLRQHGEQLPHFVRRQCPPEKTGRGVEWRKVLEGIIRQIAPLNTPRTECPERFGHVLERLANLACILQPAQGMFYVGQHIIEISQDIKP